MTPQALAKLDLLATAEEASLLAARRSRRRPPTTHRTLQGTSDASANTSPTVPNEDGTSISTPDASAHRAVDGGKSVVRRNNQKNTNNTIAPRK